MTAFLWENIFSDFSKEKTFFVKPNSLSADHPDFAHEASQATMLGFAL